MYIKTGMSLKKILNTNFRDQWRDISDRLAQNFNGIGINVFCHIFLASMS